MLYQVPVLSSSKISNQVAIVIKEKQSPPAAPVVKPVEYTVVDGDTLEAIATSHNITVQRLFNANPTVSDPNQIEPAHVLTIPLNTDVLTERVYPVSIPVGTDQIALTQGSSLSGGFSNFEWGWCTWYADQQRPDIHATGNASDWIKYSSSRTPKAGAVAVNTFADGGLGHVGIVLAFNDKQVLVRSMNFKGFGQVTDDWLPLSYFQGYIY